MTQGNKMKLMNREFTSDNCSLRQKAVHWHCPQEGTPCDLSPVCSPNQHELYLNIFL